MTVPQLFDLYRQIWGAPAATTKPGRLHLRGPGTLTTCKRAIGSVRTTSSVAELTRERTATGNVCWVCVKAGSSLRGDK
jgi:hypothetical protein